jgi:guanyl-specific ribonuclease Sa
LQQASINVKSTSAIAKKLLQPFDKYTTSESVRKSILSRGELIRNGIQISKEDYTYVLVVLDRIDRHEEQVYPDKDGSIYWNNDKQLPSKVKYREYTVPSRYALKPRQGPSESNTKDPGLLFEGFYVCRGQKRLIMDIHGSNIYYTSEHYEEGTIKKISR